MSGTPGHDDRSDGARRGAEPPASGHPNRQAIILLVAVTILLILLAAMSTFGG